MILQKLSDKAAVLIPIRRFHQKLSQHLIRGYVPKHYYCLVRQPLRHYTSTSVEAEVEKQEELVLLTNEVERGESRG